LPALVSVRNGPFRDLSTALVRRWAERMLSALELAAAELSIALTDDGEIHELNRVFRRRDRPTDVLAFAMREGAATGEVPRAGPEMLGDVVVSVETARRQAARRGRTLEAEVRELLAHGLLHLVGYDHQTKKQALAMGAKTRELCRAASTPRHTLRVRR
jgi:probable rRNA maturation factor